MNRIICIGSPFYAVDRAGHEVYCNLKDRAMPQHVELIDGGLDGLKLLCLVDGCEKVLFIDNVSGFGAPNQVMLFNDFEISRLATEHFEHLSGLPYVLKMVPLVCERNLPTIRVLGIETPHQQSGVERAARMALDLFNGECEELWINAAGVKEGVS